MDDVNKEVTLEFQDAADLLRSVQTELNALKRRFARLQKENDNLTQLYKQAAALRDFNEREKETQMRYNQMLRDYCPDDILLLDKNLNILLFTSSVKAAFDRDVTGESFLTVTKERFGDDYARDVEDTLFRMMSDFENSAPSADSTDIYELNVELGGEKRSYYSITVSPALDSEDKLIGVVVLAHDNTDMYEANLQAEAANKAKSAFLSTMSHEIRTPMNAILGITEIQLQNDSLDKSVLEALGKIYSSGDLLLGIINDILDLSKIEAGKLELVISRYEIASLISDTSQLNMMRIGSKPIEFELSIDERMPASMMGDELRVKQILNNLLSNAFKYTAAGTVKLSFIVRSNNEDEIPLEFSISDTGQGMTEDQVNRLFDEYSRFNMEANRSTEGTGLGMSITQNLIKLMDGEIHVKSEPGVGSTFTVRIPQGRVGSEILGKEMAESLRQFRSGSRAQMNRVQIARELMPYGSVLIVDDVETNIYVAKGLMTPYELKIDSAESGPVAIEKIKRGNVYDIIFMDHMMPQMDGIEATKIIRELGYKEPIVALTANAVAGQSEIFLGNGFDDFISKPIDIRQLNVVLNKLIRDKQPHDVLESARQRAEEMLEKASDSARKHDAADDNASARGAAGGAGAPEIDPMFAEIFLRDAEKSYAVLQEIISNKTGAGYNEDDVRTYVIHTHGMKSALANIGNSNLSEMARDLEQAGRDNDFGIIASRTPVFLDLLSVFINELKPEEGGSGAEVELTDEDREHLRGKLRSIKEVCEEYDEGPASEDIAELRSKTWPQKIKDMLGLMAEHLLHSDFDEIISDIEDYLNGEAE